MYSPFISGKPVSGKAFLGRRTDLARLCSILERCGNAVLYEPCKTGKNSLIRQTLLEMKTGGARFLYAEVPLLGVRSGSEFAQKMAAALNEAARSAGLRCTPGKGDADSVRDIFRLPRSISEDSGLSVIVILQEFQNILLATDSGDILNGLEDALPASSAGEHGRVSFIITGSQVNAMKELFETRHFGSESIERVRMSPIDMKEISESVERNLLSGGKIIEKSQVYGICNALRSDIRYVNHVISICDSLTRGYVTDQTVEDAMRTLVSIHEPGFLHTVGCLTGYQINLLRAICDGVTRFSTEGVMRRYGLSSSANVVRLKDALCRKEIITFEDDDKPVILDPLFEYWLKEYCFKR